MSRRRRTLSPEDKELWGRVARSARPMRAHAKKVKPAEDPPLAEPPQQAVFPPPNLPPKVPAGFGIGTRARPGATHVDSAPSVEERLAAQPLRMDRRRHQDISRGKVRPEARIDLHGMTVAEAHPELIRFLLGAQSAGKRLVLIITGKGRPGEDLGPIPHRMGVLRHHLPRWLSEPPLRGVVLQIAVAHARHGGSGAFYVYLRRLG